MQLSVLVQSLPGGIAPSKQFEPAIDQPKEEGKAKESRSELLVRDPHEHISRLALGIAHQSNPC